MARRAYGWKRSPVDHRDRCYQPSFRGNFLPVKADVLDLLPPVKNQGQTNTCGPHAAACLIQADEFDAKLVCDEPSVPFIYWNAREKMGNNLADTGVENRAMMQGLHDEGWCPDALMPFAQYSSSQAPEVEAYDSAENRRISDYAAVPQLATAMMQTIASRRPFLFGFTVYQSFESELVEQTGAVPMPRTGEALLGGHDVVIYGYDSLRKVFLFRNSYGESWGDKGNGTIPFAYACHPALAGDFWVVRSLVNPREPAPPKMDRVLEAV